MTSAPEAYGVSTNAIVLAGGWIQQTLLGTTATVVAIIAVAMVGFSLLYGLVSLRRGAAVVLGCFIIFAAPTIANALKALAVGETHSAVNEVVVPVQPPDAAAALVQYDYDPYAGPTISGQ